MRGKAKLYLFLFTLEVDYHSELIYYESCLFFRHMAGPEVPEMWRGKLNITYRLGPGFTDNRWYTI